MSFQALFHGCFESDLSRSSTDSGTLMFVCESSSIGRFGVKTWSLAKKNKLGNLVPVVVVVVDRVGRDPGVPRSWDDLGLTSSLLAERSASRFGPPVGASRRSLGRHARSRSPLVGASPGAPGSPSEAWRLVGERRRVLKRVRRSADVLRRGAAPALRGRRHGLAGSRRSGSL